MKNDIQNQQHIQQLVDAFYVEVRKDPIIGGIFMGVITDWPSHLAKMYSFWETILLHKHTYDGTPFPPHAKMSLTVNHFNHWLSIWRATIDLYFEGEKAVEAKLRGDKMASMFLSKIEFYKGSNRYPIL